MKNLMDQERLGNDLNELQKFDHTLAYEKLSQKIFPAEITGQTGTLQDLVVYGGGIVTVL